MKKQMKVDAEAGDDDVAFVVEEAIHIGDGTHTGTIDNIVYEKRSAFGYVDVYVTLSDVKGAPTIKTGFPAKLTENTTFYKFLQSSGVVVKIKDTLKMAQLKQSLLGRQIQFLTYTEDKFARIDNKSIKFLN